MAEYIEREAFIEDIKTEIMNLYLDGMKGTPRGNEELYQIIDRINEQPAADVVAVVRCKDCKHLEFIENSGLYCTWHCSGCAQNDFCSYGKRRGEDGTEN